MKFRLWSILFLNIILIKVNAQCMEQLKSAFSKMMKDSKNINAGDNMSYTNYTVKVVYNDSTNHPAVVSTIEIWKKMRLWFYPQKN